MLVAASPAAANETDNLKLYLQARTADALGDKNRAAMLYADLASSGAVSKSVSAQAMSSAIIAGRFDLAMRIANASDQATFNLDGRLFLLADALKEGRWNDARTLMGDDEARAQMDFLSPFVQAWLGLQTGAGHEHERAIQFVTGLSRQSPLNAYIDEQAAYLHLANGNAAEALPFVERALQQAGSREAAVRLAFADGFARLGEQRAVDALLKGDDPILTLARERLREKGKLGLSVDTPAAGISRVLTGLAIDLIATQNRELPLGLVQVARFAAPEDQQAVLIAAILFDGGGDVDEALRLYRRIPEASPLVMLRRDGELQALISAGRVEEANRLVAEALKRNPGEPAIYARLGDVLQAEGRYAEAADAYARQRNGSLDDWPLVFLEAVARDAAGDWETAEVLLRHAHARNPGDPVLLNYLGYSLLEHGGDVAEASAYIRAAHDLRPDDPSITDSLGWAQFKLGQYDLAVSTLGKAVQGEAASAEIHEHYGDALATTGSEIEARFAWRAARLVAEEPERIARLDSKLAGGLNPENAAP